MIAQLLGNVVRLVDDEGNRFLLQRTANFLQQLRLGLASVLLLLRIKFFRLNRQGFADCFEARLGRLAPPKGALTPISSYQNGKRVILKALLRKAFKITFQVVFEEISYWRSLAEVMGVMTLFVQQMTNPLHQKRLAHTPGPMHQQ